MDYDLSLTDGEEDSAITTDTPCGNGTQGSCSKQQHTSVLEDGITWGLGSQKLHAVLLS